MLIRQGKRVLRPCSIWGCPRGFYYYTLHTGPSHEFASDTSSRAQPRVRNIGQLQHHTIHNRAEPIRIDAVVVIDRIISIHSHSERIPPQLHHNNELIHWKELYHTETKQTWRISYCRWTRERRPCFARWNPNRRRRPRRAATTFPGQSPRSTMPCKIRGAKQRLPDQKRSLSLLASFVRL